MLLGENADYRLRGADTLFLHFPSVSVFRPSAEYSENKNHTEFSSPTDCRKIGGVCCAEIGVNVLEM